MKGQITISRPMYSDDHPEVIAIRLHDGSSGCEFIEIEVPIAEFAKALTGLGHQDCEFELRAENVGKIHEHKEEIIPTGGESYVPYGKREQATMKLLKPFEVDGWKGEANDLFNHHRSVWTIGGDGAQQRAQRVTFHRYVNPTQAKGEQR